MPSGGLFDQLGSSFDPEAELRKQRDASVQRSMSLAGQFDNPGVQGAANIGALLGGGLGGIPGLTPAQQQQVQMQQQQEHIKKSASDSYLEWERDNPDASEEDKASAFEEHLAKAAFQGGRGDVAAPLLQKIGEDRRAKAMQIKSLEELGYKTRKAKVEADKAENPYARDSLQQIYRFGEKDPMKGMTAYVDKEGNAHVGDQVIPVGQYTTDRPLDPSRGSGGSGGGGAGYINKSDVAGLQERLTGLYSRGKTINDVWNITKEAYSSGLGSAPTGRAGDLASWVDRGVNDLANLGTILGNGPPESVGSDGKSLGIETASGRKKYGQANRSFIAQYLPANLPKSAQLNERYEALVTNLAWASALSKQPGRAISDADMKMEMQLVARGLNNPETVKQILVGGYYRALDDMNFRLKMLSPEDRRKVDPTNQMQQIMSVYQDILTNTDKPLPGINPKAPAEKPAATVESDDDFLNRITR